MRDEPEWQEHGNSKNTVELSRRVQVHHLVRDRFLSQLYPGIRDNPGPISNSKKGDELRTVWSRGEQKKTCTELLTRINKTLSFRRN
jgi:hypothetical protein